MSYISALDISGSSPSRRETPNRWVVLIFFGDFFSRHLDLQVSGPELVGWWLNQPICKNMLVKLDDLLPEVKIKNVTWVANTYRCEMCVTSFFGLRHEAVKRHFLGQIKKWELGNRLQDQSACSSHQHPHSEVVLRVPGGTDGLWDAVKIVMILELVVATPLVSIWHES